MPTHPLHSYIDHTLLKATTTPDDIRTLCAEAEQYHFASVCVQPCYVSLCAQLLTQSKIAVCTVVGFPLGANTTRTKIFETQNAIENGAQEIDMVISIGALLAGNYAYVEEEIRAVKKVCTTHALLKVIIETAYLTDEQKEKATETVVQAGADFVKTSTGFAQSGATTNDVHLLNKVAGGRVRVKAAGGIRDKNTAIAMIRAGADRIGTSAGIAILSA